MKPTAELKVLPVSALKPAAYYKVLADGYRAFHFPMHILEQALADSIGREKAIRRLGSCSLAFPGRKEEGHEVSN